MYQDRKVSGHAYVLPVGVLILTLSTIFRLVLDLPVPAMWYVLLFIFIIAICTYNYMHVKRHHTIAYL